MDMESAKTQALRKHARETAANLAIACQMLWASASDKNAGVATDIILAILKDGFWAGWSAAIDYCMQPVKNGVPAGTTNPSEHTSNTTEPIISAEERKVNE